MPGGVLTPVATVRLSMTVPFMASVAMVFVGETVGPWGMISAVMVTVPEKPLRLLRVRWTWPEDPCCMVNSPVLTIIWKLGSAGTSTVTATLCSRLVVLGLVARDPMIVIT